jgi:hypothetical protein
MRAVLRDARYALRAFARAPAFTAAAILSLAIGIGANTAIFSIASALLLRPLQYADPDRLLILWNRSPGLGITEDWFSTAQYFDIKNGASSFEQVAIAIGANYNLTGGNGEPERVGTLRVSSNLLTMLGVQPAAGRSLVAADDVEGGPGWRCSGTARGCAGTAAISRRLASQSSSMVFRTRSSACCRADSICRER